MVIAGVFVGVSQQQDSRITALTYGHRDAQALFANFADANESGGHTVDHLRLLTNADATARNVRRELAGVIEAARTGRADAVFVHFSCHGSQSGDLVLFDADRADIPGSCIPVREVIAALATIGSAAVILTLDCCFAGAALGMEESPNREVFDTLMQGLTGDSRFVTWAAEHGERAYEETALAHGYLSYALIKELESARAARKPNVRIATWISQAAQRVDQLATAAGRQQRAGCYAMITSTREMPIGPVGRHLVALAESEGVPPIDERFASLLAHGFTTVELAALQRGLTPDATLNELQRNAISPGGVLTGRSMLVRAPTSGGKTLIAEMTMLRQWRRGRKTVFLLPLRALVREQATAVTLKYGDALGLRVVQSTGEAATDDDLFRRNQYDVAFLTYEKFAAIAAAAPDIVEKIGVVVVDEVQTIEDASRGKDLELLLVRLQRVQREGGWPQLLILCGELADLDSLQQWLGLLPVGGGARPIPLTEIVVSPSGVATRRHPVDGTAEFAQPGLPPAVKVDRPNRYDTDIRAHATLSVMHDLILRQKQVLVFCWSKRQAMRIAEWAAADFLLAPVQPLLDALDGHDKTQTHRARDLLEKVVKQGVAFHTSDLDQPEREAVESSFRAGTLRVLVATSTLAMGVNFPTDAVVIADNAIWDWSKQKEVPMRMCEYRNMAGRAGRLVPGGPTEGMAILVASNDSNARDLWNRYVDAPLPGLTSQLGESAEDNALALLQLHPGASPVQLTEDLGSTYWGFLQVRTNEWVRARRRALEEALAQLSRQGFVDEVAPGRWSLTTRGRIVAGFGLTIESARRLLAAIERLRAGVEPFDALTLSVLTQILTEMDAVQMPKGTTPVHRDEKDRGPLRSRPLHWAALVNIEGLTAEESAVAGDRIHRMAGMLAWLNGKKLADIENGYARQSREPVAGIFRSMIDRVVDLLPAVGALCRSEWPERAGEIREAFALARHRLAIGGSAAAARVHALRLGLSRNQCEAMAQLGVADEASLLSALSERSPEVQDAIGPAALRRVSERAADGRARNRHGLESEQMLLDGFSND